jgi:DNA-binding transcriptional LysR family regulator
VQDLNEIALFVAVVKAGSFAEASRQLRIPPNSISRRVRQLEEHLGTLLLRRSTRHLSLTEAGSQFFEMSATAISQLDQASQCIMEQEGPPRGLLRIAAPTNFFDFFLIEWVAEFLGIYPEVRVEFVLSDSSVDLVQSKIDIALRVINGPRPDGAAWLLRIPSYWHLVASPEYIERRGTPPTLHALASHDCLIYTDDRKDHVWRLSGPGGDEEVTVSGRFGSTVMGVLLAAARVGLGIALLPGPLTAPDLRAGRLVQLLPKHQRPGGGFYAVLPGRQQTPKAVSVFVQFLNQKLGAGA